MKLPRRYFVFILTPLLLIIPIFPKLNEKNLTFEDRIYNEISIYGYFIIIISVGLYQILRFSRKSFKMPPKTTSLNVWTAIITMSYFIIATVIDLNYYFEETDNFVLIIALIIYLNLFFKFSAQDEKAMMRD